MHKEAGAPNMLLRSQKSLLDTGRRNHHLLRYRQPLSYQFMLITGQIGCWFWEVKVLFLLLTHLLCQTDYLLLSVMKQWNISHVKKPTVFCRNESALYVSKRLNDKILQQVWSSSENWYVIAQTRTHTHTHTSQVQYAAQKLGLSSKK